MAAGGAQRPAYPSARWCLLRLDIVMSLFLSANIRRQIVRPRTVAASLFACLILITSTTVVQSQAQTRSNCWCSELCGSSRRRVIQFLTALRELGHIEGRNLALVQRHADGDVERLPGLAAELVAAQVDVIIALGPAVWAAKQATTTIPIVIAFSGDPERQGTVARLAPPAGNRTALLVSPPTLPAKHELLCTHLPNADASASSTILKSQRQNQNSRRRRHFPCSLHDHSACSSPAFGSIGASLRCGSELSNSKEWWS